MQTWQMVLAAIALLGGGVGAGKLLESTHSAHKRIDALQRQMTAEFHSLGDRLEKAIENAWVHCPLAHKHEDSTPRPK